MQRLTLRNAGWWFGFNPFEKYYIVKLDHETPIFRVKIKRYLSCHQPADTKKWSAPRISSETSLPTTLLQMALTKKVAQKKKKTGLLKNKDTWLADFQKKMGKQ